jgi:hypothetical protein
MGMAKKTRKFATVKRLINAKKDPRANKDKVEKPSAQKDI